MLTVATGTRVYLASVAVDLRRGHDGLCALVRGTLDLDPYGGQLFVFVGRRGDRIKVLFWDHGGFVVYYKRLAKGRFRVPPIDAKTPQNIDRLVTMFRAAKRSGRELVLDLYAASMAAATGLATIPQASWEGVRVYVPNAQRRRVMAERAFERTNAVRAKRIYAEELRERAGQLVMSFRGSMAAELHTADCLRGGHAVWSMWAGYLRNASGEKLQAFLGERGIPLSIHHSSGHAFVPDLRRLVDALAPRRLVPIHSFAGDRYAELFPRVDRRQDGEWWNV